MPNGGRRERSQRHKRIRSHGCNFATATQPPAPSLKQDVIVNALFSKAGAGPGTASVNVLVIIKVIENNIQRFPKSAIKPSYY